MPTKRDLSVTFAPPTIAEVERERAALEADLRLLGTAFIGLYLQALNGVVCDPGEIRGPRTLCDTCSAAWEQGKAVLAKYDEHWGNMYRPGGLFQPESSHESAL